MPFSVLVVDDEPGLLLSLERLLMAHDYRVAVATSGAQALEQLTSVRHDILLLNLMLPGVEEAAILDRVIARRLDLAVIAIGDTASVNEAIAALRQGAVDFLGKPFDPEELLGSLANAARKLELERSNRLVCARSEASERLHRFVVHRSPNLIFILDAEGHFSYLNRRVEELLGFAVEDWIGRSLLDSIVPEDRGKAAALLRDMTRNPETLQCAELRFSRDAGWYRDNPALKPQLITEVAALALFENDDPARFVGGYLAAHDITDRRRAEEALHRTSALLEHMISASPTVIYSRQPGPGTPLNFVSANIHELLGYRPEELLADAGVWNRLVHPDDRARLWHEPTPSNDKHPANREYRLLHRDGTWRWIRDSFRLVRDSAGHPLELVGSWLDNTEAQILSEQISYQASHDSLTGLPNRRAFEQRLLRALENAREQDVEHVLLYLDLDQFKIINDTCGHMAGDTLLRQLSRILQARVRKQDLLARLGGDEFGVLVEYCSMPDALRVANSLCAAVSDFRFAWGNKLFQVGASIGLASINAASESSSDVLGNADSACYAAKDAGRNRAHVYVEHDAELARRQGEMRWVVRINQALEEQRFQLAFQPIVPTLGHAKGLHYELLLRMVDESGQIVMPGAFLPAAERYHLAGKLDKWVVATALDWLSHHPDHLEELALCAINLSGHSLGDEHLLDYLVRRLTDRPQLNQKLCFEITETAAIANLDSALHFIRTLKDLGCRFALDDFGSGLSSFAYLKKLPVDFLKIDGVFVEDIADDPVSLAMVSSINDVGHVMGMETIAEFVENEQILNKLRAIGVNYAQGYGMGRPRPLAELSGRLH